MAKKTGGRPSVLDSRAAKKGDQALKTQMERAMKLAPKSIISLSYIGRDKNGRPMYRVRVRQSLGSPGGRVVPGVGTGRGSYPRVVTRDQTITFQNGVVDKPFLQGPGTPGGGGSLTPAQLATAQANNLRKMKDNWLTWIAESQGVSLTDNDAAGLRTMVNNWKGDAASLQKQMQFVSKQFPVGAGNIVAEEQEGMDDFWGDLFSGFDSGGGGAAPVYRAPDRRVVEDMVSGLMTSLIGTVDDGLVQSATDVYMKDHRRNWDSETQEIDPSQSALEAIRNSEAYQTIHALRPDSEDERSWISDRRGAAQAGGLTTGEQEDFAITQATVGGDLEDVRDSASLREFQRSGQFAGVMEQKIGNAMQAMFSGVKV